MFGSLTQHQVRKKLLAAESEINRAQLIQELEVAQGEARKIAQHFIMASAVVSSLAMVAAGLKTLRAGFSPRAPKQAGAAPRDSWIKKIINGVRLASSVWSGFRAAGHNGKESV